MAFLDGRGELIAPYRGPWTLEALERQLAAARTCARLRGRTDLDAAEQEALLRAELELGKLPREALPARLDGLAGLTPERRRELEDVAVDARVLRLWYELQPRSAEERAALGARYQELFAAGDRPRRQQAAEALYLLGMEWAERARRPDAMAALLEGLRAWLREAGGAEASLRPFEERLERLRRAR